MTPRPKRINIPTDMLKKLYCRDKLSVRDCAEAFSVSKDSIVRELKRLRIDRRPAGITKRGKLADIPLELLEANVKALGGRGASRTLDIPFSTLREHIARRRRALKESYYERLGQALRRIPSTPPRDIMEAHLLQAAVSARVIRGRLEPFGKVPTPTADAAQDAARKGPGPTRLEISCDGMAYCYRLLEAMSEIPPTPPDGLSPGEFKKIQRRALRILEKIALLPTAREMSPNVA